MRSAPQWKTELEAGAQRLAAKARELRRRIHAHPEPGFEERETSKLAADALRALGVETRTGVAGTGVVGLLRGGRPGRCVLLRSELDALRKEEKVELRGFGSFRVKRRAARVARNPRTGASVQVREKVIPYFKPSKELKQLVEQP